MQLNLNGSCIIIPTSFHIHNGVKNPMVYYYDCQASVADMYMYCMLVVANVMNYWLLYCIYIHAHVCKCSNLRTHDNDRCSKYLCKFIYILFRISFVLVYSLNK